MLLGAGVAAVRYSVMVCTTVTTVCGIWLAYGEPPNLIMKANLHPHFDNAFFLRYCPPAAVASYLVIAWQLRKNLRGARIDLDKLDVIDANAEDVRFFQALATARWPLPSTLSRLRERVRQQGGCRAGAVTRGRVSGHRPAPLGRSRRNSQGTARSFCQ